MPASTGVRYSENVSFRSHYFALTYVESYAKKRGLLGLTPKHVSIIGLITMEIINRNIKSNVCWLFLILTLCSFEVTAQPEAAGQIVSQYGEVWVLSNATNAWHRAQEGTLLYNGYSVKTGKMSGVNLRMEDESLIRLSQYSEFKIEKLEVSSFWRKATSLVSSATKGLASSYRLLSGKLWGRNNNRSLNAQIRTSTATIGIRGTEYSIEADDNGSQVTILEGSVQASNELGETIINSGETAVVARGQAPVKSTTIKTAGSVQWTIQIPELISVRSLLEQSIEDLVVLDQIYTAYQQQRYADVYDFPEQQRDGLTPVSYPPAMKPWLLLKTGQSAEAMDQLKALASSDGSVLINELLAFTAFIQGDLSFAEQRLNTLEADGRLTDSGWLAKGYIAQARHDLDAAAQAYLTALQINSTNLQARIQLATIYFGSGSNDRAMHLVTQALEMNPDSVQALNLKGFISLAENRTREALEIWKSLESRQLSDAETYFGLSLAQMRQGDSEQAMQNIATAVLMDPQRSMYLSYWGKMLHQIGRHDKALTVLDSAIRLDPEDPTPHLYKAIILRDLNRPGEAIQSVQAAQLRNDNQGVYRSRSLLDQDHAVQSVDLSRLFSQLGLNEWAHQKAIDSINRDFTNASAHILNAGAYAQMGGRSYALFNEALLARLYQPANINTFSSYNSYTSLYEHPDTLINLNLGAGNHGQVDASLIMAGANPDSAFAWGAAALSSNSDGWRDTNGEDFSNLSAIGKWQLSRNDNLLLSLSHSKYKMNEESAAQYEFDAPFDPYAQLEQTSNQFEAGLLHRLENNHDLMFYLAVQQNKSDFIDNNIDQIIPVGSDNLTRERLVDGSYERPTNQFQFQGVKRWNQHQLFYGALVYDGKSKVNFDSDYGLFDPNHSLLDNLAMFDSSTSGDLDIHFTSLYVQDSWSATPDLQLDLALHAEQMDNANPITGGEWALDKLNGRAGIAWKFLPSHTLRLAHFEYILPFVTARLDPSDIAGVTLFRNSSEGSLIKESDLVLDYEWANGLVSATLFSVEQNDTSAIPDGSGGQTESTTDSKKEGLSIVYNQLLGQRTGLNIAVASFEQNNDSAPDLDRSENNLSLALTHVFSNSLTITGKQVLRNIDFDASSSRLDEDISVTNLTLYYEFANKTQAIALEVINLTDEEFNWVTDQFTTIGIAPDRMYKLNYRISF